MADNLYINGSFKQCRSLVSIPGLPTILFWLLASCTNGSGWPGNIYHVSDLSVYLGRWRGKDSQLKDHASCTCSLSWKSNFFTLPTFRTPTHRLPLYENDLKCSFIQGLLPFLSTCDEDICIYAFCIMFGALAHKWSAPCNINFTQNTRPIQSIHSHEGTYTTTPPTVIPDERHLHRDEGLVSLLAWVNTILHCCSMIAVISSCVLRRKRTLHVSNSKFSDTNREEVSS